MSSIYTTTPCLCRSLKISSTKAWETDGAFINPYDMTVARGGTESRLPRISLPDTHQIIRSPEI
jgi:hypothetical protein